MTAFIAIAVVLLLAALLFIMPPLMSPRHHDSKKTKRQLAMAVYQDQVKELKMDNSNDVIDAQQLVQGQDELERRFFEEFGYDDDVTVIAGRGKWAVPVVALFIPLFVGLLYWEIGNYQSLSPAAIEAQQPAGHVDSLEQLNQMIGRLESRLVGMPEDAQGWLMLGRSYYYLERFTEAVSAYARAYQLIGDNADLLADYADAMAMANGGSLSGEPSQLIKRALAQDGDHQKALWIAGTEAYEQGAYKTALDYWQRLAALMPPGSNEHKTILANVAEVQSLLTGEPIDFAALKEQQMAIQEKSYITGLITLDESLRARVDPQDTLFIYARAATGSRMPFAALRVQVSDLPLTFRLDDSHAIMPTRKLSDVTQVIVSARISKSGEAMPQAGDVEGQTAIIKLPADDVSLVIDTVIKM